MPDKYGRDGERSGARGARNALQSAKIQHEREIKLADDDRRREEKRALEFSRENEDIQKQRDRAVHENYTEVAVNHELNMDKERLKRELERVQRDHLREKEAMERDFDQRASQKKLEHEKELQSERTKAAEVKRKLEKQIEELKAEIGELNEEVGKKKVEMTKKEADHSEKLVENENRLKTEYEGKIKKMQEDHDQEIAERDLEEEKLTQDKKLLKSDLDKLINDHENDILKRNHEHKQAVEDAIEEVNKKWRNKCMQLERECQNKEKCYMDEISHLEKKVRDDLKENEGRWQLTLKQKQNEMDFMKENLERKLEEVNEKNSVLESKHPKEKVQLKNEADMKLNEKVTELNEDFKKKLEERVNALTSNLRHEMEQKEKDHQYKMERKDTELATMEEALARAQARKTELEDKLRTFDSKATKEQIKKKTEEKITRSEQLIGLFRNK